MKPELLELRQLYEGFVLALTEDLEQANLRINKHMSMVKSEEIYIMTVKNLLEEKRQTLTELNKKIEG